MHSDTFDILRTLTDEELLVRTKSLAARERGTTAELVGHLAELEARGLHLGAGYGSLFTYCREALLLSEQEAYNRIEAARAVQRFPVVLDLLAQGTINLTTVKLLSAVLTPGNHLAVLESARGASRSQVEDIVARLAPKPDVPPSIRKLPVPRPTVAAPALDFACVESESPAVPAASVATDESAAALPAAPARPAAIKALSPDRYKLQVTISGDTREKLQRLKDLLRHTIPGGDVAAIVDRALTLLLADVEKKKLGATDRPRRSRGVAPGARRASAEVRRTVSQRDTVRCAFVSADGRRCDERAFLEFHHVKAHARDGETTVVNIGLRCRRHNVYEWRLEDVRLIEDEWYRARVMGQPCEGGQTAKGSIVRDATTVPSGPSQSAAGTRSTS
jgi:hypothetical protein